MMRTSRNAEADRIFKAYQNSTTDSVMKAYRTRPSVYKQDAEQDILLEMVNSGGHDYRIISHSGFVFTCGYMVDTEEGQILVYHTKTRREEILIDGNYHYWQQV